MGLIVLAFLTFTLSSCTYTLKSLVLSTQNYENLSQRDREVVEDFVEETNLEPPDERELMPYIRYYLNRKKYLLKVLERAKRFMPVVKEELRRCGLPEDLAYLPVIESAYNPYAISKHGAVGLWQFKEETARRFGLRVDFFTDERYDVRKSTRAACRYLKYLYKLFGSWELALAAYNCGEGCVMRRVRGNFWEERHKLPEETRKYVVKFIALLIVVKNHLHYEP